jgi:hypothetical protein
MTDTPTRILAQALISLMMAAAMSGIISLIALGPTAEWLARWPKAFAVAWPIAFCLTLFVGPLGFKMAHAIMGMLRRK